MEYMLSAGRYLSLTLSQIVDFIGLRTAWRINKAHSLTQLSGSRSSDLGYCSWSWPLPFWFPFQPILLPSHHEVTSFASFKRITTSLVPRHYCLTTSTRDWNPWNHVQKPTSPLGSCVCQVCGSSDKNLTNTVSAKNWL